MKVTSRSKKNIYIPFKFYVAHTLFKRVVWIRLKCYLLLFFFENNLEDIGPSCGVTDTPSFGLLVMFALGFKSRVDLLTCLLHHPACNTILRFTSGVTPADILAASMAAKSFSSTYLQTSIGGAWDQNLLCMLLPHSVRPGRCSTDWAMPARLSWSVTVSFHR